MSGVVLLLFEPYFIRYLLALTFPVDKVILIALILAPLCLGDLVLSGDMYQSCLYNQLPLQYVQTHDMYIHMQPAGELKEILLERLFPLSRIPMIIAMNGRILSQIRVNGCDYKFIILSPIFTLKIFKLYKFFHVQNREAMFPSPHKSRVIFSKPLAHLKYFSLYKHKVSFSPEVIFRRLLSLIRPLTFVMRKDYCSIFKFLCESLFGYILRSQKVTNYFSSSIRSHIFSIKIFLKSILSALKPL